ncbi:hypothetical protein PYCC9005_001221 [Savitreella phatthalungensis]
MWDGGYDRRHARRTVFALVKGLVLYHTQAYEHEFTQPERMSFSAALADLDLSNGYIKSRMVANGPVIRDLVLHMATTFLFM